MAKGYRTGNRKTREQRKKFKIPELGYYLIVTDTEATERCFFTGIHQALPVKFYIFFGSFLLVLSFLFVSGILSMQIIS